MNVYGLMKMGLDATELRSRTIAENIANINTPNYKRKYVTFEDSLKDKIDNAKIELKVTSIQINTLFLRRSIKLHLILSRQPTDSRQQVLVRQIRFFLQFFVCPAAVTGHCTPNNAGVSSNYILIHKLSLFKVVPQI